MCKLFDVHIFKTNGERFQIYSTPAQNSKAAVSKAKRYIQRMGKLPHFYSYVSILKENK